MHERRRRRYGRCTVVAAVGLSQVVTGCALRHDTGHRPGPELALPAIAGPAAGGQDPAAPGAEAGRPTPLQASLGRYTPTAIAIPKINVNAPLTEVGRGHDGSIEAPPVDEHNLAGWYGAGASPGEPGTAVIVGHLDTRTAPAVFARLKELKAGDIVGVVRADETVAVFRITSSEEVPKEKFPERRVLAGTGGPELRLVTCAGRYDDARHAYTDNLILYGTFAAAYRLSDLLKA
ncbi:class F sortase [Actinomadura barringtoniae]|uniref:Class F sortase n=1 Tax=Actinomadura barringtoniae TaxID=1427535 RepID=A0A939PPD0_9ACTN|nr:class F sortase [Actinomadura barringtoniae]MBO2452266.1 class F sortase [Actinomadura barringtoniae]